MYSIAITFFIGMQMAIYENLMLLLNTMHCLFLRGKVNSINAMGSIQLLPGLAFIKGTDLSVKNTATLQILGMPGRQKILVR